MIVGVTNCEKPEFTNSGIPGFRGLEAAREGRGSLGSFPGLPGDRGGAEARYPRNWEILFSTRGDYYFCSR